MISSWIEYSAKVILQVKLDKKLGTTLITPLLHLFTNVALKAFCLMPYSFWQKFCRSISSLSYFLELLDVFLME